MAHMIISLAVSLLLANIVAADKVLLIPTGSMSHFFEMDSIGRELLNRNHEVYVLIESTQLAPISAIDGRYRFVKYSGVPLIKMEDDDSCFLQTVTSMAVVDCIMVEMHDICESLLRSDEMWRQLEAIRFDIALVDEFIHLCVYLVPYRLQVKHVSVGSHFGLRYSKLPLLPSVHVPLYGLEVAGVNLCNEDSNCPHFLKVLRRTVELLGVYLAAEFEDTTYLHRYVNFSSIHEVRDSSSLALINQHYVFGNFLPELPHVKYVGGLTARESKPLPRDLDQWIKETDCAALVAFGSRFTTMLRDDTEKLLKAFSTVQCRILFRIKNVSLDTRVPDNVKLLSWIPQNDVLGQENIKLFVTHSGNNGQYEALYHGVPMLAFCFDGDQPHNARRIEKMGFGKRMAWSNFKSTELAAVMSELIGDSSYRTRIRKASAIFRSHEHPAIRAADAIENLLQFGDSFVPVAEETKELTIFELYSLDIILCCFLLATAAFYLTWRNFLWLSIRLSRVI